MIDNSNQEFGIPNDVPELEPPMPSQEDLEGLAAQNSPVDATPPTDSGEDYSGAPNDLHNIFDPKEENSGQFYDPPCGWAMLSPSGVDSLVVGAHPAKLFFHGSEGKIIGVMPTLQATGTDLDDTTPPTHTLSPLGASTQWMVYSSLTNSCRIVFLDDATSITTVLTGDEKYFEIGRFNATGGGIDSYEQLICGPEAIGDDYRGAFTPIFYQDGVDFKVRIEPSYAGNNFDTLGAHSYDIPYFEGVAMVGVDPPPSKILTAGDWEMFLVVGVAATASKATVIVQTAATTDPSPTPAWKNVYKIGTWTITNVSGTLVPSDVRTMPAKGVETNTNAYQPFEPIMWHDGTNFKAKFTPAHVQPYDGTIIDVTVKAGSMATNTGENAVDGEEWWLEITTDGDGVPTAADLDVHGSPPSNSVPDGVITTGLFYYKICTFNADGNYLIPDLHNTGNILWTWEYIAPATTTHPWKTTDVVSGNVDIEAGYIMADFVDPNTSDFTGWDTVYGIAGWYAPYRVTQAPVAAYAGGTVAVSGTGTHYIYAEITAVVTPTNEIAMAAVDAPASTDGDGQYVNVELGDYLEPPAWSGSPVAPPRTVTISVTSDDPSVAASSQQSIGRFCICKVVDGVTEQYYTHNPKLGSPLINVLSDISA